MTIRSAGGGPRKKSLSALSPCPAMARPRGFAAKDHAATRRLVQAAQRGDRRAEDELVRRYEPLVQHAVWRLKLPPWCEREDLAQEARLGLITAMRERRRERGAFPAFAQSCVKNKALLAVISASRHKHEALNLAVSLGENFADDSSDQRGPVRLVDRLATSAEAASDPESRLLVREQIDSVLHALPDPHQPRTRCVGGLPPRPHQRAVGPDPRCNTESGIRGRVSREAQARHRVAPRRLISSPRGEGDSARITRFRARDRRVTKGRREPPFPTRHWTASEFWSFDVLERIGA